jgi:hypothetical protein
MRDMARPKGAGSLLNSSSDSGDMNGKMGRQTLKHQPLGADFTKIGICGESAQNYRVNANARLGCLY